MIEAVLIQRPTTEETISVKITGEDREAIQKDLGAFMTQVDQMRTDFNEKVFLIHEKKMAEIQAGIEVEGEKLRQIRRETEAAKAELTPLKAKLERKREHRLQTA